jgi:hypothetical protein
MRLKTQAGLEEVFAGQHRSNHGAQQEIPLEMPSDCVERQEGFWLFATFTMLPIHVSNHNLK